MHTKVITLPVPFITSLLILINDGMGYILFNTEGKHLLCLMNNESLPVANVCVWMHVCFVLSGKCPPVAGLAERQRCGASSLEGSAHSALLIMISISHHKIIMCMNPHGGTLPRRNIPTDLFPISFPWLVFPGIYHSLCLQKTFCGMRVSLIASAEVELLRYLTRERESQIAVTC